jgi:mRNA-degrading endonuclease RelE of RelBE toxin-antitoxin system
MYVIFLSNEAVKILINLDKEEERRIRTKIKELEKSPQSFGKHLKGIDLWSLRVGKHRVLFEVDEGKRNVFIVTLGPRKDVYHKIKGRK